MILFKQFGKLGRLGNQLFQWAAMIGMCKKFECTFKVPEWHYSQFFMYPPEKTLPSDTATIVANEPHFHYAGEYFDKFAAAFKNSNAILYGYLQSPLYWDNDQKYIQERMSFTHAFSRSVKEKFIHVFNKPTIAVSIRRGDFVGNANHYLLPINYYIGALHNNFQDLQNFNVVVFSDDLSYCKVHFECLENVSFADGLTDIEQLCLMSQMDHFIIANSTFSWWGAYLGEKAYSKIVRPAHHFAGVQAENCNIKDHYPHNWIVYDHTDTEINKIDLPDVTFCIPVFFDHPDRRSNLLLNICMLQREFNCRILIGEQGGEEFKDLPNVDYMNFKDLKEFHRTKMLNTMMTMVETPIVYNWDADVLVPPLQVLRSIQLLRDNRADMVYPYDGRFARVQRSWVSQLEKDLDVGIFGGVMFKGMRPTDAKSVGGAMAWRKEKFIEGGMENEKMISYAPEDVERFERFSRLGYRVVKVKGVLYHIDHFISIDSSEKNPHFDNNWKELYSMRELSDYQLQQYIKTWAWTKTP